MNVVWHAGVVGTGAGDVANGADYRPTDASINVLEEIERDLAGAKKSFQTFVDRDLPAFNTAMTGKLPAIGVSGTP